MVKLMVNSCSPEFSDFTRVFFFQIKVYAILVPGGELSGYDLDIGYKSDGLFS